MSTADVASKTIRSTIPARLDRLSWSPFHTRMVMGLGAAWILDGLQITISSSVTGVLTQPDTLDMTSTEVGLIASVYLIGGGIMIFGGIIELIFGIKAVGKSLEDITKPIAATDVPVSDAVPAPAVP
jgi:hypothetical protein